MAYRWGTDDGPTLNAGLVALRISGDPVQYCQDILYFLRFSGEGGSGPPDPCPAWDRPMYTENPSYRAHRLCVLSIACTIFKLAKHFFPEFHSGLIWIQTVFANVIREKERERDWCVHILSGNSKYIGGSASRERGGERERCVCVFFLNFVILF